LCPDHFYWPLTAAARTNQVHPAVPSVEMKGTLIGSLLYCVSSRFAAARPSFERREYRRGSILRRSACVKHTIPLESIIKEWSVLNSIHLICKVDAIFMVRLEPL
jgi:hypothetical protein